MLFLYEIAHELAIARAQRVCARVVDERFDVHLEAKVVFANGGDQEQERMVKVIVCRDH